MTQNKTKGNNKVCSVCKICISFPATRLLWQKIHICYAATAIVTIEIVCLIQKYRNYRKKQ